VVDDVGIVRGGDPFVEEALAAGLVVVRILAVLQLLEKARMRRHQPVDDHGTVELVAVAELDVDPAAVRG
jgi:hypothetical protein